MSAVTSSGGTGPNARQMLQYEANKKSAGIAYLLWFFLGGLGVHRFYIGRGGSGALMLVLLIISVITLPFGIGAIGLCILALWAFVDLFLIPGMVSDHNNRLIMMMGA